MCTFHDATAVTVCDAAIGTVRVDLDEAFPDAVTFTPLKGEGTLVEAGPALEPAQFVSLVRTAITASQERDGEDARQST